MTHSSQPTISWTEQFPIPLSLASMRAEAMTRFKSNGFPTTRIEEWRQTSVQRIADTRFHPSFGSEEVSEGDLKKIWTHEPKGPQVVFVNGILSRALSSISNLPQGLTIETLTASNTSTLSSLGKAANTINSPFTYLNTALFQDGLKVRIEKGTVLNEPLELIHIQATNGKAIATHPRIMILAGENSKATFIESFFGIGKDVYFTNAVTELFIESNAQIQHYKIQNEANHSFHVGTIAAIQGENSRFLSDSIQFGGALVRNDISATLQAKGAHCSLNGLFLTSGTQHIDHHTYIDHQQSNCTSQELYKGILDDHSKGVFDGKIIVKEQAQQTDSKQTSRNLLLSEDAVIDTTPRLEISADDVKCAHGATIGSLDEESIFYLQSRGVDRNEARKLLTFAFANEVIETVSVPYLKCFLELELSKRLSKYAL